MVSRGHKLVADGWAVFEQACEEAGPGELPQLLRSLKGAVTPMGPPATPTTPVKEEPGTPSPTPGPSTSSSELSSEPVLVKVVGEGGKVRYKYGCPNCSTPIMGSKRGMDAHIRSVHTKIPLLCSYCDFTTWNMDSLNRHEKDH